MSAREYSRVRAPPPTTALVLTLLWVICSSRSHVAGGVRTTARVPGPADGGGVLGDAAPARSTDKPADRTAAEREELWATERRAATGSRLPDCAHACGPCSPCRRVMVSFMCAQGGSESCPVAYRCMCRGRFFRVPL